MRCKKHSSDPSSSVGACASCLRESLLSLIASQSNDEAQALQTPPPVGEDRRKSDPNPPPLVFPCSVSPYVSRRNFDTTTNWSTPHRYNQRHRRTVADHFFDTPGDSANVCKKKQRSRFGFIWNLFRSRSQKLDRSGPDSDPWDSRQSCEASPSSSSWISGFGHRRRRKNQSSLFSLDEASYAVGQKHFRRDRGMSPQIPDEWEGPPSPRNHSLESAQEGMKTPRSRQATTTPTATPSHRRAKPSPGRSNVAELWFCLSPLVTAGGANRHCSGQDAAYSGEIRVSGKPHLSTAASFCANRSRKLADFGRWNHNR
ncbi:hypothetical protein Nepgr_024196 [Nepenthes gracilis]|uniref:Uncharacterized protein n=1 Tax=Nepenthes gracilis TaxID=150966 RepID=A0AAD3T2A5_NEPGR|nr:hypothetical protein Nepgr_024196 [Nepenthes gracilis]